MKKDNAFKRAFKDLGGAFFALVIMVAILLIFTNNFSSKINLVNLLKQIVCNCLLSFGLTCCLITGFPDLSVGSHVALATVEVCMFQNLGISLELSILITIVIGIAIGAANGFIFSRTGMPAYFLPMAPGSRKSWGSRTHDFWCCFGTMIQAQTLYPELIWLVYGRGKRLRQPVYPFRGFPGPGRRTCPDHPGGPYEKL